MDILCLAHFFHQRMHHQKALGMTYHKDLELLLGGAQEQTDFLRAHISRDELERQRQYLQEQMVRGIQFCYPGHENYPPHFLKMSYPPFLISYLGHPVWRSRLGLAVVGSRDASVHSLQWMEQNLSPWLKDNQVFVVSGGARGIDQKAHLLCLQAQRPTVAILPSGLGQVYPSNLQSWVKEIVATGGCVMSEYEEQQPMRKHFFQARNRLISALGVCTLVVQAERRSGTLITARQSVEQNRPVLVVPSHPLDISHQGGLDLLVEGAAPVRDVQDLQIFFASESGAPGAALQSLGIEDSSIH